MQRSTTPRFALGIAMALLMGQPVTAAASEQASERWVTAKALFDAGTARNAEVIRTTEPLPDEIARCHGAWSAWNSALETLDLSEADKATLGKDLAEYSNMIAITWFNAAFYNREAEPLMEQTSAEEKKRLEQGLAGDQRAFGEHFILLGVCGGGLGAPIK